MKIYFVMTWIVSEGRIEEHDGLFNRWVRYMEDERGLKTRYFRQPQGPEGGRVTIFEFDTLTDYEEFLETFYQDEENLKFRDEWLKHVDYHTYRTKFWRKSIPEDIKEI